jgi:hypothetical protein
MQLNALDVVFWFLTFAEHIGLLYILLRIRQFPVFTALIALDVVRTITLFLLRSHGPKGSYFYTYWALAVADVGLQLGIIYELASRIFRPTGAWIRRTKRDTGIWACISIVVAFVLSQVPRPSTEFWLQVVILKGSFFSAALMSELVVGMFVLSARAQLSWPAQTARVATGFAIYSLTTLGVETANTFFGLKDGNPMYVMLSHIRIAVYIGCAGYWIVSLLGEVRSDRQIPKHIGRQALAVSEAVESRLDILRSEDTHE